VNTEFQAYTTDTARRLREDPAPRKSTRTKKLLELAAAQVLEEKGFPDMRVIDITNKAGVSEATFYTYYKDKREITLIVLSDFLAQSPLKKSISQIENCSAFDALVQMNRGWFGAYRANARLTYCLLQFGDQDPDFAHVLQKHHEDIFRLILNNVIQLQPVKPMENQVVRFLIFAQGAMMDEVARHLFVFPHPKSLALLDDLDMDFEQLVQALSVIWYRVLYPGERVPVPFPEESGIMELLDRLSVAVPG
jgi:AcrR family transcriptional regulator